MITKFTKPNCDALLQEIATVLGEVASRHGLSVEPAGGSLDEYGMNFTARMAFKILDKEAEARADIQNFTKWCAIYGLAPADHLCRFDNRGNTYEVVRFAPNKSRFPIVARDMKTGQRLNFPQAVLTKVKKHATV